MTWKDKLEIGLKEDAPYRKDNLPENEIRGPEIPIGEGRSPLIPMAKPAGKGSVARKRRKSVTTKRSRAAVPRHRR